MTVPYHAVPLTDVFVFDKLESTVIYLLTIIVNLLTSVIYVLTLIFSLLTYSRHDRLEMRNEDIAAKFKTHL